MEDNEERLERLFKKQYCTPEKNDSHITQTNHKVLGDFIHKIHIVRTNNIESAILNEETKVFENWKHVYVEGIKVLAKSNWIKKIKENFGLFYKTHPETKIIDLSNCETALKKFNKKYPDEKLYMFKISYKDNYWMIMKNHKAFKELHDILIRKKNLSLTEKINQNISNKLIAQDLKLSAEDYDYPIFTLKKHTDF